MISSNGLGFALIMWLPPDGRPNGLGLFLRTSNGTWTQFQNFVGHFFDNLGEPAPHAGERLNIATRSPPSPPCPESPWRASPGLGMEISHHVVAVTFHAAHHDDPVGPIFKGLEQVDDIHLAGAGDLNDPDIGRVLQSHRTCQVQQRNTLSNGSRTDDLRLKRFASFQTPSEILILPQGRS